MARWDKGAMLTGIPRLLCNLYLPARAAADVLAVTRERGVSSVCPWVAR